MGTSACSCGICGTCGVSTGRNGCWIADSCGDGDDGTSSCWEVGNCEVGICARACGITDDWYTGGVSTGSNGEKMVDDAGVGDSGTDGVCAS